MKHHLSRRIALILFVSCLVLQAIPTSSALIINWSAIRHTVDVCAGAHDPASTIHCATEARDCLGGECLSTQCDYIQSDSNAQLQVPPPYEVRGDGTVSVAAPIVMWETSPFRAPGEASFGMQEVTVRPSCLVGG